MRFLDEIAAELDERERRQREFHGKSDDEHGAFARWLLEAFDERDKLRNLESRVDYLASKLGADI